mgnify:CR=1 FL=1
MKRMLFETVLDPKPNDVVYVRDYDNTDVVFMYPVIIIKGRYYGDYNRVSNFWYYYDSKRKQVKCGYGEFYKAVMMNEF